MELWIEVIDDPSKFCPAFAYISPGQDPQRITGALNQGLWPVAGALARNDANALRWMTAIAILDRCATWRGNPILASVQRHLVEAALGRWMDYQAISWSAYRLKDHPLLAPIPELLSSNGPAKFAEFDVVVDSARLAEFRSRMAKRFNRAARSAAG